MKNQKNKISRIQFIKASSLGALSVGFSPILSSAQSMARKENSAEDGLPDFGIVGWSFNFIPTPQAIKMLQGMNVVKTTLKPDVQLPVNSSEQTIKSVLSKYKDAGITITSVGVMYMESKKEIDQAFDYAKAVGVSIIDAAPKQDLLEYIEQKAKEYDIYVAIHNHGPDTTGGGLYPGAKDVYEAVSDLDKRVGLCYDIGHGSRAGEDPVEAIEKYHDRIYDMHFKDVTAPTKEGKSIKVGGPGGIIDIPAVLKTLKKVGYNGEYSLEYEDDMKDPLLDMAQSIGYLNGVKRVISTLA